MTDLSITTNLDLNPWKDLRGTSGVMGRITHIGLLPDATENGRPTVALLIECEDGTKVLAETTWVLFSSAADALKASPVAELDRLGHP